MELSDFYLALITGSTSAVGEQLALALSKKGIPLLLTGRNRVKLLKQKSLPDTQTLLSDLTTKDGTKSVVEWIRQKKPNLIINCAGRGLYGPALMHDPEEHLSLFDLNVRAPIEITLAAAEMLDAENRYGTILNIASAAGFFSIPTFSTYAASKGALIQFSQALDAEMKPHRIRILTACPGPIKTPFHSIASKGLYTKTPPFAISPLKAAKLILKQIEKEKPVNIINYSTRVLYALSRFFLKRTSNNILQNSIKNRY